MPIYEYRCDQGHTFEVMRRMTDEPLSVCQTCSAPVEQVFYPVAIHFKGKGFYNTDYGTKKRAREMQEANGSATKSDTAEAAGGGDGDGKAAEAKPDAKPSETAKPAETKVAAKADAKATAPAPKKSADG